MLITCLKISPKFFEMKMFFLHERFSELKVAEMNYLIDTLLEILHLKNHSLNPVINGYNTVKMLILIYKVTWRIEKQNIYSLITKCQVLKKLIDQSLKKYLTLSTNIRQLHSFMLEPIMSLDNLQDSLDLMLEMKMTNVLNHNAVVEVLNLVYEG